MIYDVSDYTVKLYKPLSANKTWWRVEVRNPDTDDFEFSTVMPLGAMYAIGINTIIKVATAFSTYRSAKYKDLNVEDLTIAPNLHPDKLEKLKNVLHNYPLACYNAKEKNKDRKISYEDRESFYPLYLKLKDLLYIADFIEEFDTDYLFDYLVNNDLVGDYNRMIIKTPIIQRYGDSEYQVYYALDLDSFFALDLEEMLFGTKPFPKFENCNECGELFVANTRKVQYCPKCANSNERSKKRMKEWRHNEVNKLAKQINDLYAQLIEFEEVKYIKYKDRDKDKAKLYKEKVDSLWEETNDFQCELKACKRNIKHSKAIESDKSITFTTEEQVIKWLMANLAELKDRLKTYDYK